MKRDTIQPSIVIKNDALWSMLPDQGHKFVPLVLGTRPKSSYNHKIQQNYHSRADDGSHEMVTPVPYFKK